MHRCPTDLWRHLRSSKPVGQWKRKRLTKHSAVVQSLNSVFQSIRQAVVVLEDSSFTKGQLSDKHKEHQVKCACALNS